MSAQSNGIGTPGRNEPCEEHSMLLCRLCNRTEKPKFGTVRKPLKAKPQSRHIRQADYLSAIGKAKARQGGVCVGLLAGIDHECTEMEWLHGVDQRTLVGKLGPDTPALTDDRIGAYGCRWVNGSLDEWRGPLRDTDTRLHLLTFWHPEFDAAVIEYGLEVEAERKWEGA